jgi:toxin FitB
MIIPDTKVLSELLRPEPAGQVERWLAAQDGAKVCFTTVGEAELRHGVATLPAGKRRNALTTAIEGAAGRPISQFDCQIAAIARANEATVATRNTSDYEGCGIGLIDPWSFRVRR